MFNVPVRALPLASAAGAIMAASERFIRSLNEQLLLVGTFQNVEELRCALAEFRERYNQPWIVQRLGYLTPQLARQVCCILGAVA